MDSTQERWVELGRVSGLFGVRGWVKVFSDTAPRAHILDYSSWYLKRPEGWKEYRLKEGHAHGKGVVALLEGYDDRDQAVALIGSGIAVPRDHLPEPGPDEYYWTDLEGLRVQTLKGVDLGTVDHLFATGSNDVLVVKGERKRLLPFTAGVISEVDLRQRVISVDWDPDF